MIAEPTSTLPTAETLRVYLHELAQRADARALRAAVSVLKELNVPTEIAADGREIPIPPELIVNSREELEAMLEASLTSGTTVRWTDILAHHGISCEEADALDQAA